LVRFLVELQSAQYIMHNSHKEMFFPPV